MFVKVKFHGILKKLCPKVYEIDAKTPAEAIRGLTNQLPQLKRKDGKRYQCQLRECPTKDSFFSTLGDITELNIYPTFMASGGGNGGLISFVIGAILVVVGAALWYFSSGTAASVGTWMMKIGAAMMLGGTVQMLTPVPRIRNTQESQVAESRIFNSNKNTTAIGTRIAVAYGRNKIYGQLLSFNTQAVDRGSGVRYKDVVFVPGGGVTIG